MIPKVEACLTSLEAGRRSRRTSSTVGSHALLLEIFTHTGIGTEIVHRENVSRIPLSAPPSRCGLEALSFQSSVFDLTGCEPRMFS